MEPEGSLPHSHVPTTCHCPEPDKSSPFPHPTSWRSILILSSHLRLGLPSGLFPSGFPTETLHATLLPPYVPHAPPISLIWSCDQIGGRSQWPRGQRRRSAAARLLRLWVRIPPEAWMSVCCDCCVLSSRSLSDWLITHLEESYRMWCIVLCDLETSWMRSPWPTGGCRTRHKQKI